MAGRLLIQVREDQAGFAFDFSFPDRAAARGAFAEYYPPAQPNPERDAERVRSALLSGFHGNPRWLEDLRSWGCNAFVRHLPEELQAVLETLPQSQIILKLGSQGAAAFPWELLHDGRDFLARKHVLGRLLKSQAKPRAKPRSDGRMLILANLSQDLPAAEAEGVQLTEFLEADPRFKALGMGRLSTPRLTAHASRHGVQRELEEAQVVHFCSHTSYVPGKGGIGWVLSKGEFLTLEDIQDLGKGANCPALVFSNSCAPPPSGKDPSGTVALEGIAEAFLAAGVGGFIGTLCEVEDKSSLSFSMEFYRALTPDKALPAALLEARRRFPPEIPIWAAYRYYGDPHFKLRFPEADTTLPPQESDADPAQAPFADGPSRPPVSPLRFKRSAWIAVVLLALAAMAAGIAMSLKEEGKQNFHYMEGGDRRRW